MLQISDEDLNAFVENEDLCSRIIDLEDVYPRVEANIKERQDKVRKRKLSKGAYDSFMVGDKVLRKNIRQEQRKGGKLEADLLGPFTITQIEEKSVDLRNDKGKILEKINIDHLKRYVVPQPRIPSKWIATTATPPAEPQPSPFSSSTVPQSPTFTPAEPQPSPSTVPQSPTPVSVSPEECKYRCNLFLPTTY